MNAKKNVPEDTIEILIVEDSPTQAEQLKHLLEQNGHKVLAAASGKQALALLDNHKPALVISDIVMPEMDGYELCRQIKTVKSKQDIPVILLTSLSDAEDVLKGLECGADNFITKPYNEEYLLLHIEQNIANRKLFKNERVRVGLEIMFGGKRRFVTADQQQMLTLLISTYEEAVRKNAELVKTQNMYKLLNERLEGLVEERTAALTVEIEARKKADERIRKLNRVYAMLSNINQAIVRVREPQALFKEACRIAVEEGGFRMAWIGMADFVTGSVNSVASAGVTGGYLEKVHIVLGDETQGSGPIGRVLKAGEYFVWNDMENDPRMVPWHEDALRMGFRSCVAFPLKVSGQVCGVLKLYAAETSFFDDEELKLLDELAMDVSFAIEVAEKEAHRKLAEEALQESETRYRAIFEASAEGILIADLETKIFKYANPSMCRMLGYTENELIIMSVADIHPKDALQGVIAEFEAQACGEKTLAAGLPCLRKDGTVFYADVNAVKITIDGKECNAGFFRDITERKLAEEALRQSEERFRILFEQAADIILQLEITPEGIPLIREANSATFRLLGYEREELIGQPVSFIEAAPDASKVVHERRQNVLSGIGTVFESRHRCKDNTILDVECSVSEIQVGSKTFAVSVERDITARKQAEETLRQSEERYRCITQAVTDYIYTVRIANGRPMETIHGEACVAVTGYTAVDFLADPFLWLNMVNKKDHPAVLEQTRQILAGLDPKPVEHRISRKDGKERWVLSTLVPHFNDRRSLLSYEGIIQDITDRKKAEIELKKAHDELEKKVEERTAELNHANKAKSDFLASMSHELRTPLNSVIGFSQVLQEQYFGPLNEKQLEYARDIEEGGNHLLSLINDVLDLSKIEAGKEAIDLSTFNLSLLLKNSFVMIKEKCHKHGIALSADIPAGLEEAEITADERKIKQVVFNLLSNASKFTPDGGAIKLGLRRNGGEFLVVVTDNGIGVPMEYQQKIFEDFYQIRSGLTSKTRGTGLGLALCKRLVEMHGGRIWVVSEGAEKGSAFSFSIPVKQSSKITPP